MAMAIPLESYANALNLVDVQEICDEAQQKGEVIYQQTGSENRFNLPQRFGQGGESEIHLRSGITLIIRDLELWQSIKLENHYSQSPPLISKFHLSGNSRVLTPNISGIKDDYMEVSGCNYLYHLPKVIEFEESVTPRLKSGACPRTAPGLQSLLTKTHCPAGQQSDCVHLPQR